LATGTILGDRYQVERELGSGGFGTTYAAIDLESERRVAVKVLDLRRVDDWKAVELFEREARVLRTLDHPGIPEYIEFRPLDVEREAYLVQELAPGTNLASLLDERRFSEHDLRQLAVGVLEILDYLTRLHPVVVHRDIKPGNILLADDGTVSLVDFGAVRDVASATIGGGSTVAGTFGYMAPEQLQGLATPSSDLYGLGMTLVHLATGRDPSELDKKRLKPDFRRHCELSDELEELIDKMIEPVPDDRFQTAAEVLAALRAVDRREPDSEALSSAQIAEQRAAAERDRSRRAPSRPAEPSPARVSHERVSLVRDDDGCTVAIRPARYWRGREFHFAALLLIGPVTGAIAGPLIGIAPWLVGVVATPAMGLAVWLTAPTWRLRTTRQGDFVFYARSPRRPKWVGRTSQLKVDPVRTARGDYIVHLRFRRNGETVSKHFYPMRSGDGGTIKRALRG
jgi:hypothetical protein